MSVGAPKQPLLVLGVVATERHAAWRARLRSLYKPFTDSGIVRVRYILDAEKAPAELLSLIHI